jgi:hypothetical protein
LWLDQLRDFYLKKLNGIWDSEERYAIVHAPNRNISSAGGSKFKEMMNNSPAAGWQVL